MKFFLYLYLIILFSACTTLKHGEQTNAPKQKPAPEWVQIRPSSSFDYIGIGVANKTGNPSDFMEIAKRNAISDLVSQIDVKIDVNALLTQTENLTKGSGKNSFEEQYKSIFNSSSAVQLTNLEPFDTWQNDKQYWTYYKLNKADYADQEQEKENNAINKALPYYKRGIAAEQTLDITLALGMYVKAFEEVKDFLHKPLKTNIDGKDLYLASEIIARCKTLQQNLAIETSPTTVQIFPGKPANQNIIVFTYFKNNLKKLNVQNCLLKTAWEKGNGNIIGALYTDNQGSSVFKITQLLSRMPLQVIKFEPDFDKMLSFQPQNSAFKNLFYTPTNVKAYVTLELSKPSVYIQSKETNINNNVNIISNSIKQFLTQNGLIISNNALSADYIIQIEAETSAVGINFDIYTSTLNGKLVLYGATDKTEKYNYFFSDVKGAQLDYQKAGLNAFQKAAAQFETNGLQQLLNIIY